MVVYVRDATNKKTNVNRTVEFMEFGRVQAVNATMATWDSAVESKKMCPACSR